MKKKSTSVAVIKSQPGFLELLIDTGEGVFLGISFAIGILSGLLSAFFLDSFPQTLLIGATSSLVTGSILYWGASIIDTLETLMGLDMPIKGFMLKLLTRRRIQVHRHIVSAQFPAEQKTLFAVLGSGKSITQNAYICQTNTVWTWKGFSVEQVLTPTNETTWDTALEQVATVYKK